jgi:hypothetical protein
MKGCLLSLICELRKTAVTEKTLLLAMKVYVDSSALFGARLRSVKNIIGPIEPPVTSS